MIRYGLTALASGALTTITLQSTLLKPVDADSNEEIQKEHLCINFKSREQTLNNLKQAAEYDILVIGGGATGCGIAVDAASRGLSVALVEKSDYSSGTSSKSTKLIHGGVRYLQKAVMQLDREQYHMVKEALAERANLIRNCPYLAYPIPIMLPMYSWWQVPYFWVGIKLYDLLAGRERLKSSRLISKRKALELFPMLKSDSLRAALVYYDGQHNDSRMNVAMAMTASGLGADVTNHVEVVDLIHDENGKVCGARCVDQISGEKININARTVVNATGALVDIVRRMDRKDCKRICQPSSGIHIVLPGYYCPTNMGLLDPSTKDGRVVFLLPWESHTIAGTTDAPCDVTDRPQPSEDEVDYILQEIGEYVSPSLEVRRGDVLSVWAGVRPLVFDPSKHCKTEAFARNHVIEISDNNLITIAGGKWTTYRQMAEDTVDAAVRVGQLTHATPCVTRNLKLIGSESWSPISYIRLVQEYGLDSGVAKHLSNTYGDMAEDVVKLCRPTGKRWPILGRQLHSLLPYVDGEVRYAVRQHARTVVDVLANRTRMAFLNVLATREALNTIVNIMAEELGWSKEKANKEMEAASEYLRTDMGWRLRYSFPGWEHVSTDLHKKYQGLFDGLDKDRRGFITVKQLSDYIKKTRTLDEEDLSTLMSEFGDRKSGVVEREDFCKIISIIESGKIGFGQYRKASKIILRGIDVERSGGGI